MENIKEKINEIDKQISELSKLKQQYISQLKLKKENQSNSIKQFQKENLTPAYKINLFRSYFKGRDDVFAKLWISKNTGKKGYSPVCKNEWIKNKCNKPFTKCLDCSNREFLELTDNIIYKHLSGAEVVGLYPMLKNDNCYFLAIDFDKENWFEDIFELKNTCDNENIPVAIERSRSGNGGHAWIFFNEQVPAVTARKLGTYLITKTMNKQFKMSMKSYDRFFPNQDFLTNDGLGNLIALPFQKQAVNQNNSVFIDNSGNKITDQWNYLKSIKKISLYDMKHILGKANLDNQYNFILNKTDEEETKSWLILPSNKQKFERINNLPNSIEIVIANRIYIKEEKLPSKFINLLKYTATFHNPEFYKKQKLRFSTYSTPRVITCCEFINGYISLPRGCFEDVKELLNKYSINFSIKDERYSGKKFRVKFKEKLEKEQISAINKIISQDIGILVAPPGTGKTVMAIAAIAKRKTNTLILVHRKNIMEQWKKQLSSLLTVDKNKIGQIGGNKDKATGVIDVAMFQSMDDKNGVDNRIINYGFIIVDECHHISAFSFEKILNCAKAKYVLGLTATPYRNDGHQPIINFQCGKICYQFKQEKLLQCNVFIKETTFNYNFNEQLDINDLWKNVINNTDRNNLIVQDILEVLQQKRFPLIITERKEHLKILCDLLKNKAENIILLYGGIKQKEYKNIIEQIKNKENKNMVIIATGSYIGEGFDEPSLDTLFLAMPSSFKGKIVQYTGRLLRKYPNKQDVKIYDYVDNNVLLLQKMFDKRLKTYKALKYNIIEPYSLGI